MINPLVKHDLQITHKVLMSVLLPPKVGFVVLLLTSFLIFLIFNVGIKLNIRLLTSDYRWLFFGLVPFGISVVTERFLTSRISYFRMRSPMMCLAANKSSVRTYQVSCRATVASLLTIYLAIVTRLGNIFQFLDIIIIICIGYLFGGVVHIVIMAIRRSTKKIVSMSPNTEAKNFEIGQMNRMSGFYQNPLYKISASRQIHSTRFLRLALGFAIVVPLLVFCVAYVSPKNVLPVIYFFSSTLMLAMLIMYSRVDAQFVKFCGKVGFGYWETVKAHSVFMSVLALGLSIFAIFDSTLNQRFYLLAVIIILVFFQAYMALKIAYFRFRSERMSLLAVQKDFLVLSLVSTLFFPLALIYIFLLIRKICPLTSAKFLERI